MYICGIGGSDQKNWCFNENNDSTYVRTDGSSSDNNIDNSINDNGQESVNNDHDQESVNTNEALIYNINNNKRLKLNNNYIINNYVHGVMIGREVLTHIYKYVC
jgi:hypothetical protein